MAQFSYTTTTKDGRMLNGIITASTRELAINVLRQQGSKPISIQEVKPHAARLTIKNKVRTKELMVFTRELSTMVSAGVPLPRSLETLAVQTDNKYFREAINAVIHDVESGLPLADALSKHPKIFSEVYINMVRAGEAGGILDDILKRLATQVEKDASIKHKIHGAMAYPIVIMTVTVVAFFGIMLFIMPKISKIITDLGGENASLPIYSRIMINISAFMQHNILFILVALGIAIFIFRRYISSEKGLLWWHGLLLRIPVLGKVLTKIAVARFSRTFASLMGSGVTVLEALQITGKAIGNRVIQKELTSIAEAVKNGQPLGKQMLASTHFPPIVGQMITVGEETGKIDEILVKVADFYEEEVDTVIDSLASIIEPVMIIILGTIVGLIAASVMGPIAGLSKQIG